MSEYASGEEGTFDITDINGRGVLLDTRNGKAWRLCGVHDNKPYFKPIRWPEQAEEKP